MRPLVFLQISEMLFCRSETYCSQLMVMLLTDMHTTVHTDMQFSICETEITIKTLKRCKFRGTDPIPTELIQARGKILRSTNLLCVKVIFPEYYLVNQGE
jgi:hypothetical protein